MNRFSFSNRKTISTELQTTEFDLLIIGGGITGAEMKKLLPDLEVTV